MREKIANFTEGHSVCRVHKFSGGRCVRKSPISQEEAAFAGLQKVLGGRCVRKSPVSKKNTAFAGVQGAMREKIANFIEGHSVCHLLGLKE